LFNTSQENDQAWFFWGDGGGPWEGQQLFYIMLLWTAWDEAAAPGMAAGKLFAAVL